MIDRTTFPFLVAAAVLTGPITGGDHGQPFSAMTPVELTQAGYTRHLLKPDAARNAAAHSKIGSR